MERSRPEVERVVHLLEILTEEELLEAEECVRKILMRNRNSEVGYVVFEFNDDGTPRIMEE